MKLHTGLLYFGLLLSTSIHAQIYVWTDEHGNKVYGDAPQKSDPAEAVDLEPLNILGFPEIDSIEFDDSASSPRVDKQYTDFSLSSPSNGENIRSVTGKIQVVFNVQPGLAPGHTIQLYLDGSAHGSATSNTTIQLQNIIQGTHSIKGVLRDENGRALKETAAPTFSLYR